MFSSLLIANRGEIACRVIRTARQMGLRTVAVYSDADAEALHVRQADQAVHIGPSPARESYLVGEKIIAAARETGVEAIHPGYGFLSENAAFAQAVIDAGLIWVGPKPASITAMGLKDAAKTLMEAAGVPVTPGYLGENQDPDFLAEQAAAIGYPVLIKAVAGGGGKGMRRVDAAEDFADALASCKREAAASFGNDVVLIEKYILSPRHIEVQVFGDAHGNVVHLFERDCSVQRRHQKVIEEAPAPGMDEATRAAICAAAVRAAKAVNYEGAGTIEFIADASEGLRADRIWFMEMNTRLQVEHPVTEEITGVDLVEWQLRVAAGEAIPLKQEKLSINGWAMEARLYAEDPAKGFLPSVGRLKYFDLPRTSKRCPVRVETGVEMGTAVSPYYDPMLAKIIVHRPTREEAANGLEVACADARAWPVKTNAPFLINALNHDDFIAGRLDTGLIEREAAQLIPLDGPTQNGLESVAWLILARSCGSCETSTADLPFEGWDKKLRPDLVGLRLNAPRHPAVITLSDGSGQFQTEAAAMPFWDSEPVELVDEGYLLSERGQYFMINVARTDSGTHHHAHDGDILSPMPGKVIAVDVAQGQAVTKGQKLLALEAMKMEHTLTAPFDGTVAELTAVPGAQVQVEALLARIEAVQEPK